MSNSTTTFGTNDFYIKRAELGEQTGPAVTLSNQGISFGPAVAITDKSSGGAIGTAAATTDVGSIFLVNQTTASQTLTIPSPTTTSEYKIIIVANVGSQSFTMLSTTVTAGAGLISMWNGSAWIKITL